jgi:hypothetical protein
MTAKLERLAAARIQLLPAVEITTHYVFERDGFVALVERRSAGFGGIGAAGLLTQKGIAPLVFRGEESFFVVKDYEQAASPEDIQKLRSFQTDLEGALS